MEVMNGDRRLIIRPEGIKDKSLYSIIVVDDQDLMRNTLSVVLKSDGYERVYSASGAEELEVILQKSTPDLILMDLDLGRGSHEGFELMTRIDEEGRVATNYLIMSGHNDKDTILKALRSRAMDFLEKPIDPDFLKLRVEKALIDIEFRCQALTDPMTKMANKGTFYAQINYHIITFARHDRPLSLVMMDVDNFKYYNDTFGHLEGDYVLKKIANHFPPRLRKTDLFARYGGEEFAILMPETSFEAAFATFNRVYWDFKKYTFKPKEEVERQVTFSAGISTLNPEVRERLFQELDYDNEQDRLSVANKMIKAADQGLYSVKENGKNNCFPANCLEEFR